VNKFKTMGIAVAMALALTAFAGAGTAAANNFKSEVEPAKWSGSLTGKNHAVELIDATGHSEQISCSSASFSGETTIKTLSSLTVTPALGNCNTIFGGPLGWQMNGCKYRFKPGAGPALVGSVDIVNCEKPMSLNLGSCVREIGNQNGVGTVTYTNVGTTIVAAAKLNSIKFTTSGCGITSGTFYNGTYSGEWTIKGSTPSGVPVTVSVESTSAAPFTKFAAEEAPVTIAGADTRTGSSYKRFNGLGGLIVWCTKYNLSGTSASATSETISVVPAYSGCTYGQEGPAATVSAGECSYVLHANGSIDIAGLNCASKPMTITVPGCVYTFGPQSGFPGNGFANEGSGKLRAVSMSWQYNGLTYTRTGESCEGGVGTFNTGSLFSVAKLSATNSKGEPQGLSIE
jgi:hypothetical protein